MRRKDREMPEHFALSIVDKCEYGVMATVNEDGSPYCVPLSVVRDGNSVYFHCANEGQKIANIAKNPQVCISCVGDTHIPQGEFTTEYESAIIFGTAKEVKPDDEKIHALRLLCLRYTPGNMEAFNNAIEKSLSRTAVWKVEIEHITGKRKKYGKDGKELKFGRME